MTLLDYTQNHSALSIIFILNKGFKDLVDFFSLNIKLLNEPTSLSGLEFLQKAGVEVQHLPYEEE